ENSCRSTSGSKACTGCHPSVLRIVQSFADRCPRHHHCPSHSEMPPIRELWECQMAWVSCKAPPAYAVGVAFAQDDAAPLLCAITAASSLLRAAPSLDGALLLSASPFGLVPFASHRRRRFPQFNIRARSRLALPLCRTPSGP